MRFYRIILYIAFSAIKLFPQTTANKTIDVAAMEQKAQTAKFKSLLSAVTDDYDIKYLRCEWVVNPAVNFIKGNVTTYFLTNDTGFKQIQFDLATQLTVDSVHYHNSTIAFSQLTGDLLEVHFPGTISKSSLDSLSVYYHGVPPGSGFGSFIQSTHGSTPIIWTLSEPFGAKDWWPCKQSLNDKADSVDVIITTPQSNRVGSNGLLISETQSDTNKIYHWKTRYPIAAYLVGIAVTNYSKYSNYVHLPASDSMEVLNYVYPENLSTAQSQTPDIVKVIEFYDSLLITYPFSKEKYGHAQFGWGGGMEHQTMSFVVNFSHGLIAHECAHQWFGDHVTCGSWHDIWLNEGFATYMEGLTEQRFFPGSWGSWKSSTISNVTSAPNGSVYCTDTTSVNTIFNGRLTYNKGAYLLHMLKWELGDSAFFSALKNYLNDPKLSGKYAYTADLKSHLETACGKDLTYFFNQWFYGQGYPSYQVYWGQNNNTVSITVDQTQSDSSVPFYKMHVPLLLTLASGDTMVILDHQFSGQTFSLNINSPLLDVRFDPDLSILSAKNLVSEVINFTSASDQILVYPNPVSELLSIYSRNNANPIQNVEIYDVLGKALQLGTFKGGEKLITFDSSQLSKGTYLIKAILRSGEILTVPFVKH